jgi:hypothetical protein
MSIPITGMFVPSGDFDLMQAKRIAGGGDAGTLGQDTLGLTYAAPAFVKLTGTDTFTLDTNTYYKSGDSPSFASLTLTDLTTGLDVSGQLYAHKRAYTSASMADATVLIDPSASGYSEDGYALAVRTKGDCVFSIKANGNVYVAGDLNLDSGISASSFASNLATGSQPYACNSTTLNTNLNADLLDGQHASEFYESGDSPSFAGLTLTGTGNVLVLGSGQNSDLTIKFDGASDAFITYTPSMTVPKFTLTNADLYLSNGKNIYLSGAACSLTFDGTGDNAGWLYYADATGFEIGGTGGCMIDGTVTLSEYPTAGFVKTDASGVISIDTGSYTGFHFLSQTAAHVEITAGATTPMTCLINGNPTATSVVYDTEANEMDWTAARLGLLVVYNITRGTSRLVSAINKTTNTMTTVSTTDAWANNDSLTLLSQTVGNTYIDVDMITNSNPAIPVTATGLKLEILLMEQTRLGANEDMIVHPTSTWAVGSEQYLKALVLSRFSCLTVDVPLVNNKISFKVRAGTNVYVVIQVVGYWL